QLFGSAPTSIDYPPHVLFRQNRFGHVGEVGQLRAEAIDIRKNSVWRSEKLAYGHDWPRGINALVRLILGKLQLFVGGIHSKLPVFHRLDHRSVDLAGLDGIAQCRRLLDQAQAHIELGSDLSVAQTAKLRLGSIAAMLGLGNGRRDYRALAGAQMAANHVSADDERDWVVALVLLKPRLESKFQACPVPITPVQDLTLGEDDRLAQAMRFDVGFELLEFRFAEQRKDLRSRMG